MTDSSFHIDATLIGDRDSIEARVAEVTEPEREALRLALSYLYLADGPISIPRDSKSQSEQHLTPVELFVFQWLYKRTDGKLRRLYGSEALEAVKRSHYRCEECDFSDVRALNLEKTEYDEESPRHRFTCLCANCNTVAARAKELANIASKKQLGAQVAAAKAAEIAAADESPECER